MIYKNKISSLRFGKDVVVKYTYDKAGRLISKVMKAGKEETLLCSYTYDKLDRRIKAVVNGIKWKYKYDKYSQLIYAKAVNEGEKLIYKYKYDDIGNRLAYQFAARKEFFKYNSLNQIANNGYVYDDYGNLIKTPDTEYTFDLHNRLVMVRKDNSIIKYSYDPLGQRIKSVKTVESKPSGTTLFLMSGMIEQARAKVASGGKQLASVDFHTLGLDLAGSLTATGGVGAVLATSKTQTSGYYTRTYLYDGNGNVISLCKPDTGTITANYTYSPFGKLIKSEGIDQSVTDFTFSTKYADETGLSYYGFRFYSAKLGRWLKRDKIQEKGGINLFNFCKNFVNNTIDRYGFDFSWSFTLKIPQNPSEPWQDGWETINKKHDIYMGIGRRYNAATCICEEYKRYRDEEYGYHYKYKHGIKIDIIVTIVGVDLPLSDVESRLAGEIAALIAELSGYGTEMQVYNFTKDVSNIFQDLISQPKATISATADYTYLIKKDITPDVKVEVRDEVFNSYKTSANNCPEFFAPTGN